MTSMDDTIRIRTWTCSCDEVECELCTESRIVPSWCPLGKDCHWTEGYRRCRS